MAEQHFAPVYTNFNGGEISARMQGRTDTQIYPVALAEMINFAPSVEGPAVKVPGFRYIRAGAASSAWLSTFVYSRTQSYVIEWLSDGDETPGGKLRFFTNGGRIESDPDTPYEVAVPYTPAQAPFVCAAQSYDRQYLAHRAHATADLTRTSATTFTYAALTLEGGPFADQNIDKTVTVAFTSTDGSVTGYATGGDVWQAAHQGELFQVETRDYAEIPQWQAGLTIANGDLRASDGKVYQKIGGAGRTGDIQPTHTEGAQWDGDGVGTDAAGHGPYGAQWLYVHDRFGIVRIDEVVGAREVNGTVLRRLPNSAAGASTYDNGLGYTPPYTGVGGDYPRFEWDPGPGEWVPTDPGGDFTPPSGTTNYAAPGTFRWAHAAINDVAGWPVAVLLAWGRLVLFTDFEVIASVVGDYGGGRANFSEVAANGIEETDTSFRRRLSIANPVLWAREDRGNILVGTQDGEYLVGPINAQQAVSAENIQCVKQTRNGSDQVWPLDVQGETIFVQRGGRKLRQASYSFQADRYTAANINIWSRHILKPGCIQLAFEQESEEMLWALRADGVLACHPVNVEQEIKGFARATHAAGPILSAVAIPSEEGDLDELWVLVTNALTGAKSIEQRAPWWVDGDPASTAFFVDSGATATGTSDDPLGDTITGLLWLAGRDVDVLANGAVLKGLSVDDYGALALPKAGYLTVTAGLKRRASFKTLKPELRDGRGRTMQVAMQRLWKIGLRLIESLGVKINANGVNEDEFLRRGTDVPMGEGMPFFTGDVLHDVTGAWNRNGQFELVSDEPGPCTLVAAVPRIAVTE